MEVMKKVVAVIDDEKDLSYLIKEILEKSGRYDVIIANDGAEGQNLCLTEVPDLILLDYIMPKLNGNQVVSFLKANEATKNIPVIIMSGLDNMLGNEEIGVFKGDTVSKGLEAKDIFMEDEDIFRKIAEKFEVEAYLPKPFNKESLLAAVDKISDNV